MMPRLLVDVHSHIYLPRYAAILRSRTSVPRILSRTLSAGISEERLHILNAESGEGRPVGAQYWDRDEKLQFMDDHEIDVSIVSSANPWLDFLPASEAVPLSKELNNDLESYCSTSPSLQSNLPLKRLYGFGMLPFVPGVAISSLLEAIQQVSALPHLKGIIMGTQGIGNGLDDTALDPVWGALEKANLVIFLHPHYGVDEKAWGARENGHVLPLALGFPFETATAVARMILSGVLERFPSIKILLAHSGGALPQLSSRLASCIAHDPVVSSRLKHDARFYFDKLWYDAVAYGPEEMGFVSDVISRAKRYASDSKGTSTTDRTVGSRKMLFGTDHPFFAPLQPAGKWPSVLENLEAIDGVSGWGEEERDGVRGGNALRLFGLA